MFVQRTRNSLLIPGFEIPGAWLVRRINKCHGARCKPQNAARGTSNQHTPYALRKGVSATSNHDAAYIQFARYFHYFVRRSTGTL